MNAEQSSGQIWKSIWEQARKADFERVHTPIQEQLERQTEQPVRNWVQRQAWNFEPWNTTFSIVVGTQAKEDNDG